MQHVPVANKPEPEINQAELEAQPDPEAIWPNGGTLLTAPKKTTKQRSQQRAVATEANVKAPPRSDSDDVSTTLPSDGDNAAAKQVGKSKRRRQRHQLAE